MFVKAGMATMFADKQVALREFHDHITESDGKIGKVYAGEKAVSLKAAHDALCEGKQAIMCQLACKTLCVKGKGCANEHAKKQMVRDTKRRIVAAHDKHVVLDKRMNDRLTKM